MAANIADVCAHCGEPIGGNHGEFAEIASTDSNPDFDPYPDHMHALVHATCALELINNPNGHWQLA